MSTLIKIYDGQPGTTNTTLYTCGANDTVRILAASAVNVNAATKHFSLHIVPSGESPGDDVISIDEQAIENKKSYPCPEIVGQVLKPGDILNGLQETASCITLHISGVLVV